MLCGKLDTTLISKTPGQIQLQIENGLLLVGGLGPEPWRSSAEAAFASGSADRSGPPSRKAASNAGSRRGEDYVNA